MAVVLMALIGSSHATRAEDPRPVLITPDNPREQATDASFYRELRRCGTDRFRHGLWVQDLANTRNRHLQRCLVFSPTGDTVYVNGGDVLFAYDTSTGKRRFEYRYDGLGISVRSMPDGELRVYFLQGPEAGHFVVLEHGTGRQLYKGTFVESDGNSFVFDDDRRALRPRGDCLKWARVRRRDTTLVLFDLTTGRALAEVGSEKDRLWSLSPDEDWLALIDSRKTLTVYSTADGTKQAELPLAPNSHYHPRAFPTWSHDSRFVYAWAVDTEQSRLVETNARQGTSRVILTNPDGGHGQVVVSADGKYLAYPSHDPRAENPVWKIVKLDDLTDFRTVDARPAATVGDFSPDSKSFWLASESGLARFDLASGQFDPLSCDLLLPPSALSFSADGTRLFGVTGNAVLTWDVATGQESAPRRIMGDWFVKTPYVRCVAVDRRGEATIWAGGDSHVRRIEAGRETCRFHVSNSWDTRDLGLAPNMRRIVYVDYHGEIQYGDLHTGKTIRELLPKRTPPEYCQRAIAPDNNTLALARCSGHTFSNTDTSNFELWDLGRGLKTGGFTAVGTPGSVKMVFSGDSRELWIWQGGILRVWDVKRHAWVGSRKAEHTPLFPGIFMPHGHRYLDEGYRKLHLVERHTDQICKTWKCYDRRMTTAAFSRDMTLLAIGCPDGPVMLCDVYGTHADDATSDDRSLEDLWSILSGDDARKAFDAMCEMIRRRDKSVAFLKTRLSGDIPADTVQLIAQLDADEYDDRERASEQLGAAPEVVAASLEAALKRPRSQEQAARLERLLLHHRAFPVSGALLRDSRAVEVLEIIDSRAARTLLEILSSGEPQSRIARESVAALQRLRQ